MINLDFEDQQIEMIIKETEKFMKEKGCKASTIIKNNMDGGYVAYSNKRGTTQVSFFFLPNYDVVIEKQYNWIVAFFRMVMNKTTTRDFKSLKTILSPSNNVDDFKCFINKSLVYMQENSVL